MSTKVATKEVERAALVDRALQLYLADHSHREIGKELGVSNKTAYEYVHLALRQLGSTQETRRRRDTKVNQLLALSRSCCPKP